MSINVVARYLAETGRRLTDLSSESIAYLAMLDSVSKEAPLISRAIVQELHDQRSSLKLIASENYCSLPVQLAMGNLLSDKYAEGAPGKRFYAGCDNVDDIEEQARQHATKLFGAEHAYVQPHSGADANLVAFLAILHRQLGTPFLEQRGASNLLSVGRDEWSNIRTQYGNQRLLGMDLAAGGHLTHGYRLNISAILFDVESYGVDPATGLIDYDHLNATAEAFRPLVLLVGYSAYPRRIDFARMRAIADNVGAVLLVDMAHFSGLVAGKVFCGQWSPVGYADIITSTTHKTLRGPRGGLILCSSDFAEQVDKGCPYVLGGPLPNVMAAKAVCFEEALKPSFAAYSARIVENARALSDQLQIQGFDVVSGGTDNHLVLVDVRPFGLTGRQAESALRACGITLNRNMIPGDTDGPWYTSGLRFGTPAVTTLGMGPAEMRTVGGLVQRILASTTPVATPSGNTRVRFETDLRVRDAARDEVADMLARYTLYPELDLGFLRTEFAS